MPCTYDDPTPSRSYKKELDQATRTHCALLKTCHEQLDEASFGKILGALKHDHPDEYETLLDHELMDARAGRRYLDLEHYVDQFEDECIANLVKLTKHIPIVPNGNINFDNVCIFRDDINNIVKFGKLLSVTENEAILHVINVGMSEFTIPPHVRYSNYSVPRKLVSSTNLTLNELYTVINNIASSVKTKEDLDTILTAHVEHFKNSNYLSGKYKEVLDTVLLNSLEQLGAVNFSDIKFRYEVQAILLALVLLCQEK